MKPLDFPRSSTPLHQTLGPRHGRSSHYVVKYGVTQYVSRFHDDFSRQQRKCIFLKVIYLEDNRFGSIGDWF